MAFTNCRQLMQHQSQASSLLNRSEGGSQLVTSIANDRKRVRIKKGDAWFAPFLVAPRIKKHLSDDGAKSMPSSSTHWQQMIDNPRRPVIYWHPLKVIKVCNVVCPSSVQGLRPLFLDIMSLFDPRIVSGNYVSAFSRHTT